eukprot:g4480.t1
MKRLSELPVKNSLIANLSTDPADKVLPRHQSRPVKKGHFLYTEGEALKDPFLELGLDVKEFEGGDENAKTNMAVFTADTGKVPETWSKPWTTCYGVSVHGYWATNSPFGVYGYGDGRAMSVVEVATPGKAAGESEEASWELQLKGSGRTAFSRNHDGRAVLRSSVREFLASEAFHHLGVPSTRALCLYGCHGTSIQRAWYPGSNEKRNYQLMRDEPCAITTRASPSFLRVGQIELFARTRKTHELVQIVKFAMQRDFPEIAEGQTGDLASGGLPSVRAVFQMLDIFAERQAKLHAEWLRVGYIQGNMNNDNALLCGRTMDFGPFGMLEEYNPRLNTWEGDMEGKFAYRNQPSAGQVILMTLCQALVAVFAHEEKKQEELIELLQPMLQNYPERWKKYHFENCRKKLGLAKWSAKAEKLYESLEKIMETDKLDFTHFFRGLSNHARPENFGKNTAAHADKHFKNAIYFSNVGRGEDDTDGRLSGGCRKWLDEWTALVKETNGAEAEQQQLPLVAEMKATSPAIIPRNWMMVLAYEAAEKGDFSVVKELHKLFENPYADDLPCKWNTRSPEWQYGKLGVRLMS